MRCKILAVVLSICMVVSLIPTAAFATDLKVATKLPDAVDGTIQLTESLDLSGVTEGITLDSVTLDLNGHNLKLSNSGGNLRVPAGKTVVLKDSIGTGKIYTETVYNAATAYFNIIEVRGTFTMESGLIEAVPDENDCVNKGQFAIGVLGSGKVNIAGGKIRAGWYAVNANGALTNDDAQVNVSGGTLTSVSDYGIYAPRGKVTISGGTVIGAAGAISLNGGTLNVTGGTVSSLGTGDTGSWSDGTGGQGKAAIMVNAKYQQVTASISGGTINAAGDDVFEVKKGDGINVDSSVIEITGGTFNKSAKDGGYSTFIKTGYSAYPNSSDSPTAWIVSSNTSKTITIAECAHGTVITTPSVRASAGETVQIVAEPDDGYKVAAIAVTYPDGPAQLSDANTFIMPNEDVTVTVTFTEVAQYDLTFTQPANGSMTVTVDGKAVTESPAKVTEGAEVVVTVSANKGYSFSSLSVGGKSVTSSVKDGKYTFTMEANTTVSASMNNISYKITTNAVEGGTVNVRNSANMGEPIEFRITPKTGYVVTGVVVTGEEDVRVTEGDSAYTFTMPACDVSITVSYAKITISSLTASDSLRARYVPDTNTIALSGKLDKTTTSWTVTLTAATNPEKAGVTATTTITADAQGKLTATDAIFAAIDEICKINTDGLYVDSGTTVVPATTTPVVAEKDFSTIKDAETKATAEAAQAALTTGAADIDFDDDAMTDIAAKEANNTTMTVADAIRSVSTAGITAKADGTDLEKLANSMAAKEPSDVKVVVQVYMDVSVSDADKKLNSVTYSITPMKQVVVTSTSTGDNAIVPYSTKSGNAATANAFVVTEAKAITVTTPTEVSLPMPAGTADGSYVVKHVKSANEVYYYNGPVTDGVLNFKAQHGFSSFTVFAEANDPRMAQVGDVRYETLQAAINAVANNGTITLVNDCSENVTINKELVFTLNINGKDFKGTIKGATGYTVSKSGNVYTCSKDSNTNKPGDTGNNNNTSTTPVEPTATLNINSASNGKVTASPTKPSKGSTVTLTVTPDAGYELDKLTVKANTGKEISTTKKENNQYTFTMREGTVTVTATFKKVEVPVPVVPPVNTFIDVPSNAYFANAVTWAVSKGITNGTSSNTFSPNISCTRADMVTFLWRAAGSPTPAKTTTAFKDIETGSYYYNAVLWAEEKGIANGTSLTTFSPKATVTRAQTVTFLFRTYGDGANGYTSFVDVPANSYYKNAVAWAQKTGVANGTSYNKFSPGSDCTRGQIVTFLYRQLAK